MKNKEKSFLEVSQMINYLFKKLQQNLTMILLATEFSVGTLMYDKDKTTYVPMYPNYPYYGE